MYAELLLQRAPNFEMTGEASISGKRQLNRRLTFREPRPERAIVRQRESVASSRGEMPDGTLWIRNRRGGRWLPWPLKVESFKSQLPKAAVAKVDFHLSVQYSGDKQPAIAIQECRGPTTALQVRNDAPICRRYWRKEPQRANMRHLHSNIGISFGPRLSLAPLIYASL